MPTPVFPTAYKVEVKGLLFSIPIENVWYCQGPDPFDATAAATIAADFQVGYADICLALSQDVSYNEIEVTNLGGVATGSYTLSIIPAQLGDIAQDSLPGASAICISLRSALTGRRFRGRKYFSGLGEGDVTGNFLDATRVNSLVSSINTLIATLAGDGVPMSIFSPTGLTLVPVTAAAAFDGKVDSQRGRMR